MYDHTQLLLDIAEKQGQYITLTEYSEPGYNGKVALSNWNSQRSNSGLTVNNTMPRLAKLFEKLGYSVGWEDEYVLCDDCGKAVRCSPDCYSWKQSYWQDTEDGSTQCQECMLNDSSNYINYLEGNELTAMTMNLDLENEGYIQLGEQFENGLYGGQSDDPNVIAESLRKKGITRFIFSLDSTGQFDISFSVWIHKSQYKELELSREEIKGVDPAIMFQKALRDASIKMSELPSNGCKIAHCDLHAGKANVEFIEW